MIIKKPKKTNLTKNTFFCLTLAFYPSNDEGYRREDELSLIIKKIHLNNVITIYVDDNGNYLYIEKDIIKHATLERFRPNNLIYEGEGTGFEACLKEALNQGFTLSIYKDARVFYAEGRRNEN